MLDEVDSVTVIGCGLMGFAITKTLGVSVVKVAAWNRTASSATNLAAFGVFSQPSLVITVQSDDCIVTVRSKCNICFIKGYALCTAYQISDETVRHAAPPALGLLHYSILQTIAKITAGDYTTSKATLQVYHEAVNSYIRNQCSQVKDAFARALRQTLAGCRDTNLSQLEVASTISRRLNPG